MNVFELSQNFSKQLKIAKTDYVFGENGSLNAFSHFLEALEKVNLKLLDDDNKKKVFWINIYNALTNYWIIKKELKSSMKEDAKFFRDYYVKVGNHEFSLNDIEHGLLRKNARQHLRDNDPKLKLQVQYLDYRIHFALNCGAMSCPAIANYTLSNIEGELNFAEASFSKEEFQVNHNKKIIVCSELFVWYREDFKNRYLNNSKLKGYSFKTIPYNWSI